MEKIKKILVIPADFDWADIGHWRTVKDILSKNVKDNFIKGTYVGINSEGNLIYSASKRLIATVGLKDVIIIDTEDALLVCKKNSAQDVKKIVEQIRKKGLKKYL